MQYVDNYQTVESVLRSDHFQPALHLRDSEPLLDGCVLTLTGEEHRKRRRLQRPLFERKALAFYEHKILKESLQIAFSRAENEKDLQGRPRIDLLWLTRMTLVPVTAAVVGLDGVNNENSVIRLEDISRRLGEGASVEWSTRDHDEVMEEAMEAKEDLLNEFYTESLERRKSLVKQWKRNNLNEADLPIDLLTLALREDFDNFDEDLWLREALFFVVASANTTTHATPHVFHEIIEWNSNHPDETYLLEDSTFLRHAVEEALRLHGPVPALLRRATKETELKDGQSIQEGEDVACLLGPANTNPDLYGTDGSSYDPHRTTQLGRREAHGLSFGSGAHLCSGRPLAIGLPNSTDNEIQVIGVLPRLMSELFKRGARPDPANPPTLRTDTEASRYESYFLIFESWDT